MKNFGIECLTLLMVAVMVYAAPTNPCEDKRLKLKQIRENANRAKDNVSKLYVSLLVRHMFFVDILTFLFNYPCSCLT